jgi:hypothetical protein
MSHEKIAGHNHDIKVSSNIVEKFRYRYEAESSKLYSQRNYEQVEPRNVCYRAVRNVSSYLFLYKYVRIIMRRSWLVTAVVLSVIFGGPQGKEYIGRSVWQFGAEGDIWP